MLPSRWKSAVISYATDAKISAEVDLGGAYEFLTVIIPTLSNASTTTVHISDKSAGTFVPMYMFDTAAVGDFAQLTDDADTTKAIIFRIGGAQHIKVVVDGDQTADTTFRVRGFNSD